MIKLTLMVLSLALAAQAKTRISRLPDQIWRIPKFRTTIEEKIVGGGEVTPHSIPYQVSLQHRYGFPFCGGSIVSAKYIITAAHCCDGQKPARINVLAGKHDLTTQEASQQVKRVKKIHMHPEYSPRTFSNDICVLELKSPLDLNKFVQVVPLAKEGETFAGSAVVSGWGTMTNFGATPDKLRSVEVPLVPDEECRKSYGQNAIEDSMMCAGEEGKDSCQGDSGGPLMCGGTQCGVASWGYGCALEDYPGVYAEISYFADFLNGWIKA